MQILLSNNQAGPGRTVKQEQEEISPNHVLQTFIPGSVLCICSDSPDHFPVPVLVGEGVLVVVGLHAVRVRGDDGGPGLHVPLVSPYLCGVKSKINSVYRKWRETKQQLI